MTVSGSSEPKAVLARFCQPSYNRHINEKAVLSIERKFGFEEEFDG